MMNLRIAGLAAMAVVAGAFAAFATPGPSNVSTAVATPSPTTIIVYELPNFKGSTLTFERRVASLAALSFNDKIASVKIKGTRDWVLCEHRNFMGKCVRVHMKEKDLKRLKIAGQVSSLYPVADAPPAPVKPR